MTCVTTVSNEVCLNGTSVGPIIPKCGLRQGDPLSPYLFLLCVKGLSNFLDDAANNGMIHGSRISPTAPSVTHLLFTDDSFLFFKATREEAMQVKLLLKKYEDVSGQSVNFQKSAVFCSANVRRENQAKLSDILEVHNEIMNSNYLGLPSLVGRSPKRGFGFTEDRVSKRLQT